MSFQENLNRICKSRGTTLTALIKQMGYSTSKVTRWNEGSLPKQEVLKELADILKCSVKDFFDDELELSEIKPQNEDEDDILRVFRSLSRKSKHEFMAMVYEFENKQELEGDRASASAV